LGYEGTETFEAKKGENISRNGPSKAGWPLQKAPRGREN
jgi:hypothetical protein